MALDGVESRQLGAIVSSTYALGGAVVVPSMGLRPYARHRRAAAGALAAPDRPSRNLAQALDEPKEGRWVFAADVLELGARASIDGARRDRFGQRKGSGLAS